MHLNIPVYMWLLTHNHTKRKEEGHGGRYPADNYEYS